MLEIKLGDYKVNFLKGFVNKGDKRARELNRESIIQPVNQ
jgi:hypothetical protein